jgi:hypothetical protein
MSQNNTIVEAGPPAELVWQDRQMRLTLRADPKADEWTLMRTTDYDSGPAQTVRIPGVALSALAGAVAAATFERAQLAHLHVEVPAT